MFSKKYCAVLVLGVVCLGGCDSLQVIEGEDAITVSVVEPGQAVTATGEGLPWSTILGIGLGAVGLNASKRVPYEMIIKGAVNLFR